MVKSRALESASQKGGDMKEKVFGSMEEAVEAFAWWGKGAGPFSPKFPMGDDSEASNWAACQTRVQRVAFAARWKDLRSKMQEQREAAIEDFISIMGYERNGRKFDEKMGWPALGMWHEAVVGSARKNFGVKRQWIGELIGPLGATGASVEAFQAMYPDALIDLLTKANPSDGPPIWDAVNGLLELGWNPSQWMPATFSEDGCSSLQGLLWACPGLAESEHHWKGVIKAAMVAGFDLESRSMSGLTALGGCLVHTKVAGVAQDKDPRVAALLSLGADPRRTNAFWVCNFEEAPATRQQMLGMLEADQIGAASEPGEGAALSKKRPSL